MRDRSEVKAFLPARLCLAQTQRATAPGVKGSHLSQPEALRRGTVVNNGCPLWDTGVEDSLTSHHSHCNPRGLVRGHTARWPRLDTHSFSTLSDGPWRAKGRCPFIPTRVPWTPGEKTKTAGLVWEAGRLDVLRVVQTITECRSQHCHRQPSEPHSRDQPGSTDRPEPDGKPPSARNGPS